MPTDWWHGWADTWAELVTVIPVRKVSALGCVGSPIVSGAGASMQRTLNPPDSDDQDDEKEQVEVAHTKEHLQRLLKSYRRGLIVSMIHKFDGMPANIN